MRARMYGAVLLVVLGTGLLIRVTHRNGVPPKNPDSAPVEIRAEREPLSTETVNPKTGNLRLTIPIRATKKASH